ncbi:hypothetical protein [Treponema succinifaciens]|uniref:hypothetical protein n=1 Tax=Treponema succinifaciens TaxID=167 RepID=UPI003F7F4E35
MEIEKKIWNWERKEGIATEVKNEAIKRLISYNLLEEMQKQNINKTEMAKKCLHLVPHWIGS